MRFKSTYFYGFRNIKPRRHEWSPGLNFITGPNGAGKTNLLEGLSLISGWGTLEGGTKISSVISRDGTTASLWAQAGGERECELFAAIGARSKMTISSVPVTASAMRRAMPIMIFLPDGVSLVRGGASARRALYDRVCALIWPEYAKRMSDLKRLMQHKSRLLRQGASADSADRALVSPASFIWEARGRITEMLSSSLSMAAAMLPPCVELAHRRGGGGDAADAREDFVSSIERSRAAERSARVPLVGPQRDDMTITTDGLPAVEALSRGQSRRLSYALVMAASRAVEERTGRRPVLVFDEMMSDLDSEAEEETISSLASTGLQVFATGARQIDDSRVELHFMREGAFV